MIQITDFFVTMIQGYMLSSFCCKHCKTKYPYWKSLFISMAGLQISYLFQNYCLFIYNIRAIFALMELCVVGWVIFDGSPKRKLCQSLIAYGAFTGLDLLCSVIFYPWMKLIFELDIYNPTRLLLGRCLYNLTMYLTIIVIELILQWRKNERAKNISLLVILMGFSQILIFYNLYQLDAQQLTDSAVLVSAFYSAIVILGHFVVMELFGQEENQRKKQAELERMAEEKQYQYNYYKQAYAQSEKLRDIRHDMRNQLQAVRYLMQTEDETGRVRAGEMIKTLSEKMES